MLSLDVRIDEAWSRFEGAWRTGAGPRIEHYLQEFPEPEREVAMQVLLRGEIDLRREQGETPRPHEYTERFHHYARLIESTFEEVVSADEVSIDTDRKSDLPDGPTDPGVGGFVLDLQTVA